MQALTFVFAFVAVLALIGVAAWLVRRFAGNRLGANTNRGRMPRLAVIDAAAVDGRRRLVLVRRDNTEHLLMIGGPTDIVVESNIVRAMTARDPMPQRPAVGGGEPAPRIVPLSDAVSRSDGDGSRSDAFDHTEPQMPEPPPRPARPSFADEIRRPAAALSERRAAAAANAQRTDDAPRAAPERTAKGPPTAKGAPDCPRARTRRNAPAASADPGSADGRTKSRRDGAAPGSRVTPAGRRRQRTAHRCAAGGARTAAGPPRPATAP